MTETGAAGASFTGYFYNLKLGSCGFVNPIVDLRFCDEDGVQVKNGTPGEIWVKSPTTISGYANNPKLIEKNSNKVGLRQVTLDIWTQTSAYSSVIARKIW